MVTAASELRGAPALQGETDCMKFSEQAVLLASMEALRKSLRYGDQEAQNENRELPKTCVCYHDGEL